MAKTKTTKLDPQIHVVGTRLLILESTFGRMEPELSEILVVGWSPKGRLNYKRPHWSPGVTKWWDLDEVAKIQVVEAVDVRDISMLRPPMVTGYYSPVSINNPLGLGLSKTQMPVHRVPGGEAPAGNEVHQPDTQPVVHDKIDNHIHGKDGAWYWLDETSATYYGPYATQAEAKDALRLYWLQELEGLSQDPVFQKAAEWWYYGADWRTVDGPFCSRQAADEALIHYIASLSPEVLAQFRKGSAT